MWFTGSVIDKRNRKKLHIYVWLQLAAEEKHDEIAKRAAVVVGPVYRTTSARQYPTGDNLER